jgi:hypothetical protein
VEGLAKNRRFFEKNLLNLPYLARFLLSLSLSLSLSLIILTVIVRAVIFYFPGDFFA